MNRKLILTDIDGTALSLGANRVSPYLERIMRTARKAGHWVGVSTGRSASLAAAAFTDPSILETGVFSAGQQVTACGHFVVKASLPIDALERVKKTVEKYPDVFFAYLSEGALHVTGAISGVFQERLEAGVSLIRSEGLTASGPIEQAFIANPDGGISLKILHNELIALGTGLTFDNSQGYSIDIQLPGHDKGTGVRALAGHLDIALDDIWVFGDSGNDMPMLQAVPNSVAVANASPEVAATARWHIGRCDDDAVAHAIEALIRDGHLMGRCDAR